MVLRLVSNIHAISHSLFDMVGVPVIRVSLYDLGFVSLDSAPELETINEFIVVRFLFMGVNLGYEYCTTALGLHILHYCG